MGDPDYPFPPRYFNTAAGRIHYIDEGAGDPTLFVHGNPSSSFEFRMAIAALAGSRRCVAPDHLGLGLSDKPAGYDYLPGRHAAHLEALVLALDLRNITLVFSDWGGPIALDFATRHPDRVKALLVTNSWCWPVHEDWYYRLFSGFMGGPLGRFLIKRLNFFAGAFLPAVFGDRSRLSPEIHRRYKAPFARPADRKATWVFPGQIVKAGAWLASIEERLGALSGARVAILWGGKDIAFRGKELERWRRIFPAAPVSLLPGCGHYVAEEAPEAMVEALRSLAAAPR